MTMSSSHICNSNNACNIVDDQLLTEADDLPNYREEMINLFQEGVDVSPKKDGGLLKILKKSGHTTTCPLFGDKVYLKFNMYLENGQLLDSWMDQSKPYSFTIGDDVKQNALSEAEVILAWEFGIPTMNEGEVSMFRCRPELAYGSQGRPPLVPPDATLVFQVELLHWHGRDISDDGDGSIYTSLLSSGETYGMPNEGAQCRVEIIGRYKTRIFEERIVSFQLGEGSEFGVVAGIEQALLRFSRKEKSRLKVKSHMAYGSEGCEELGIPADADLEYDVQLLECIRAKDFWDMTPDEKLAQSMKDKRKALHYFERGNVVLAKKFFGKVVEYLQFEELSCDCDANERRNLLMTSHANLALCHLKENNPYEAFQACTKALELDSRNEKCLFRRATASIGMKDFKSAVDDLSHVIRLNPHNRAAEKQLISARKHLSEVLAREKQSYKGMFETLPSKSA